MKEYSTAGGIVIDEQERVLLIERTVMRDGQPRYEVRLPKGHIDEGESAEVAAQREVYEESGYQAVEIIHDLGVLDNRYEYRGEQWLRHEHYFLMRLTDHQNHGNQSPHPDSEEASFVCRWVADLATAAHELTYSSEQEFVRRAQAALARS
jgi:8-oxo-dGTP pyrophosphatase MutT (NUDIX family)